MKVGNLVKRLNDWVKHNPWMADLAITEIGMITAVTTHSLNDELCHVLWPRSGLKVEHANDLEIV
jgi:hypothetical protein